MTDTTSTRVWAWGRREGMPLTVPGSCSGARRRRRRAAGAAGRTVGNVSGARNVQQRLLTTPFAGSWLARARAGDRYAAEPTVRAGAWGHWAVESLTEMTGAQERTYPAILLEGRFHDPHGRGPLLRPHIEIPPHALERPDPEFPDRLAQIGNGLAFEWWVAAEATAARRALFNTRRGDLAEVLDVLNTRREQLTSAVWALGRRAAVQWGAVEQMLVSDPEALVADAAGDFSDADVADFLPAAVPLQLTVAFDPKLRDAAGTRVGRRMGVWQVAGVNAAGERFSFGVLTPRLTANSQFRDRHFAVERESPAALLVRGLVLRRLAVRHLGCELGEDGTVGDPVAKPAKPSAYLRAVVPQVGGKIPEAGLEAAVLFLQTFPDADEAWAALSEWAERTRALLTVAEDGFKAAHRRAARFIARAEDPERDDVNVLLPLCWDDKSRIVRVTLSRRRG